jgi:DNA-binding response OmpR family regulator
METILVIEDDQSIALGIEKNLRFEGFRVLTARDGEEGLELAINKAPDAVILDVMLPRMSGFEVLKTLRKHEITIPVLMLTARDQEIDKIMGLDLGADDYITKPFSIGELLARVRACLRRRKIVQGTDMETFTFDDVEVDFPGQSVRRRGKEVEISLKEFELLRYMIQNRGKALSRDQILNKVWGYDYYGTNRTIDNFITKLRQKLEKNPNKPLRFITIRGLGYKFQE